MDNLYLENHTHHNLTKIIQSSHDAKIIHSIYQQSTNSIVLIDNKSHIYFINYNPKAINTNQVFTLRNKTSSIQDIFNKQIILFVYLVQTQNVLIVTKEGDIITIQQNSEVNIQAQNQQGILGASVSPVQQYLYVATKNNTLIQLDMTFDLIKEVPVDNLQQPDLNPIQEQNQVVSFTWRADGKNFCVNFPTKQGRKCLTRDVNLAIHNSPSKSDPDPEGFVQSVSQKGNDKLQKYISWQPLGGMISGVDTYYDKELKKEIKRIIFWEKNGLRHLQFKISQTIKQINSIEWISCRPNQHQQLLVIEGRTEQKQRQLLFYHRANYHWYLKQVLILSNNDKYLFIQQNRITKLAIIKQEDKKQFIIEVIDLKMKVSEQKWKTSEMQSNNNQMRETLFYCVDGNKVNFTDFSRAVIPPPMSQFSLSYVQPIRSVVRMINQSFVLIFLSKQAILYEYSVQKGIFNEIKRLNLVFETQRKWSGVILNDLIFINHSPVTIQYGDIQVKENPEKQLCLIENISPQIRQKKQNFQSLYQLIGKSDQKLYFSAYLQNTTLKLYKFDDLNKQNEIQTIVCQQCTSFTFYHQFILFTALSNGMYQKLFIFNLLLDTWLYNGQQGNEAIKQRIQQLEKQKQYSQTLNHRAIQRGGIIVSCTKGRVVLELPRGNLQTFYPKVISICSVKKCIEIGQYRQAFELIRTHKLDLNLVCDINHQKFMNLCEDYLKKIQKVDYINLLVSQLNQSLSSQLKYCFSKEELEEKQNKFQIQLKGKKINTICSEISKVLRSINQEKYIFSIFTSQIKRGKLEDVLFEIKQMRTKEQGTQENKQIQNLVPNLPPHIVLNSDKNTIKHKKKTPQQILEYVCWLVDAQVIYQASLLTYDLQLASITARCTQKDPKQYIPYLQSVKALEKQNNGIQLKKKICLDLKKYDKAVQQLAKGDEGHIKQALQIIRKHKLFKCGLQTFHKKKDFQRVIEVKKIIIDYLMQKKELNQAFNMCCSIHEFERALQIGIVQMDSRKIKEVYHKIDNPKKISIKQMIQNIKQSAKKCDLAILYLMDNNFEEATKCYIKAGDYKSAFSTLTTGNLPLQKIFDQEILDGFRLGQSLMRNQLIKQRTGLLEKFNRLQIVQKSKQKTGNFYIGKPRQNQDMYSEISMSSKSGTQYTVSTTTGLKKKKQKKRNILSRNVKQGSPLQQQYLLAFIKDLQSKSQANIKQAKILIQNLIYLNLIDEANVLKDEAKLYADVFNHKNAIKTAIQLKFQQEHPEAKQIYSQQNSTKLTIESFDYIL